MHYRPLPIRLSAPLIAALCSLTIAGQTRAQTLPPSFALASGPSPDAIRSVEDAREMDPMSKSVQVGYLKEKSHAVEILKIIGESDRISSVTLHSSAMSPQAVSQLQGLDSLRSLTLDRRHFHIGDQKLHKAVSELKQLTSLQLRWIDLYGP